MSADLERLAKIKRARLGWEDHGILTCWLDLDYGGAGQGAGGYALDTYDGNCRIGTAYGMEFVARLMRAAGVNDWSDLRGRTVFAVISDGLVRGIKPLPTEPGTAFIFADLADEMNWTVAS